MLLRKRSAVMVYGLMMAFAMITHWPQSALAQGGGSFFSQGQAVYDPQNLAKSQQQALQDLLVQGVTQALGTLLSPAEMGSHYAALESKVLKNPDRYVQTYQIFSENPSGGLYRVTGQVTVSMDALKSDVRQMGLEVSESAGAPAITPVAPEQTVEHTENQTSPKSSQTAPVEQQVEQPEIPEQTARAQQDIVWAVAENWNGDWVLPGGGNDPRSLFAMSVVQESQDYLWSMNFPSTGSVGVDASGNVSRERLHALAQSSGIQNAVVGTVTVRQDAGQGQQLQIFLKVIDIATGKSKGEIHKEMSLAGTSSQEAAIRMSYEVVPQLDQLLRGPAAAAPQKVSIATGDEWTLLIRSEYPYASWDALQQVLKERFSSMQINRLEVGQDLAKVKIQGMGSEFLDLLQSGVQLRDGSHVQVSLYSPENRSVELTTVRF